MIKIPQNLDFIFPSDYIQPKIYGKNYQFEWGEGSKGIPKEDEHHLIEFIEDGAVIMPHSLDSVEKLKQKSMEITKMNRTKSAQLYETMIQLIRSGKHSTFSINMTWDAQIFVDAEQRIGSVDIKWQLGQLFIDDSRFSR